jgi:hypothetical protein
MSEKKGVVFKVASILGKTTHGPKRVMFANDASKKIVKPENWRKYNKVSDDDSESGSETEEVVNIQYQFYIYSFDIPPVYLKKYTEYFRKYLQKEGIICGFDTPISVLESELNKFDEILRGYTVDKLLKHEITEFKKRDGRCVFSRGKIDFDKEKTLGHYSEPLNEKGAQGGRGFFFIRIDTESLQEGGKRKTNKRKHGRKRKTNKKRK